MAPETKTLTLSCHCNLSVLTLTLPTSSFPLPTHFCACHSCRHTHGTLATLHTPIPPGHTPCFNPSSLTEYKSSERVSRWFCPTCGAHVVDYADPRVEGEEGKWCIATALVGGEEGSEEGLWDLNAVIFAGDCGRDGGLGEWVRGLKLWEERRDGDVYHPHPVSKKDEHGEEPKEGEEKLKASCHCRGVQFYIERPRGYDDAFGNGHMPESLTPKDGSKWYASNDVCTPCRLVSSSAITSWCFPEMSHIQLPDGTPWSQTSGTQKVYKSSEDVTRSFCGVCGALVSYAVADRPHMVDIGVGLLEGRGALAEEWLEWRTEGVSHEGDAKWVGLVKGLKEGMEEWGRERVK